MRQHFHTACIQANEPHGAAHSSTFSAAGPILVRMLQCEEVTGSRAPKQGPDLGPNNRIDSL